MTDPAWHQLDSEEALPRPGSNGDRGLADAEAHRRIGEYGHNEIFHAGSVSPWTILLAQFRNRLIVILLFAGVGVLRGRPEGPALPGPAPWRRG
jgi:Ca2+-transporting ATPase